MKKIIGVAAFAVVGMIALSSCKKEYSCNCTDLLGGGANVQTEKGKDAEDACNEATDKVLGIPTEICTPA
tara:strand:- start:1135 stop:1344 length:210 start_codon:yes stop_codon:yes gene_type:complete